ncbi:MAG: DUF493 family protein [Immundisolibacteraceae bacterium]|nr:DUF493 family protein [Immundisolibacteraceae bacterium]
MADRSLDEEGLARLAELLNESSDWPLEYLFKFIVPADKIDEVKVLFPAGSVALRQSRTGKYQSVSATLSMPNSDAVLAIYRQAALISGLMAL